MYVVEKSVYKQDNKTEQSRPTVHHVKSTTTVCYRIVATEELKCEKVNGGLRHFYTRKVLTSKTVLEFALT